MRIIKSLVVKRRSLQPSIQKVIKNTIGVKRYSDPEVQRAPFVRRNRFSDGGTSADIFVDINKLSQKVADESKSKVGQLEALNKLQMMQKTGELNKVTQDLSDTQKANLEGLLKQSNESSRNNLFGLQAIYESLQKLGLKQQPLDPSRAIGAPEGATSGISIEEDDEAQQGEQEGAQDFNEKVQAIMEEKKIMDDIANTTEVPAHINKDIEEAKKSFPDLYLKDASNLNIHIISKYIDFLKKISKSLLQQIFNLQHPSKIVNTMKGLTSVSTVNKGINNGVGKYSYMINMYMNRMDLMDLDPKIIDLKNKIGKLEKSKKKGSKKEADELKSQLDQLQQIKYYFDNYSI